MCWRVATATAAGQHQIPPDRLWNPKWAELRWLPTCVCQQEPQSLVCMCVCHQRTPRRRNKCRWQKRRGKKKKAHSPVTCDPRAQRGGAPHAYRGGSNRVYDCIICSLPHHLSTHQWTLEAAAARGGVARRGRRARHHSFTRLLGAFVRWLLAEKGKQINTSPMGLTGNLYLGWNMSGTSPLDSLTVTGQLTGCTDAPTTFPRHWKFILGHKVWRRRGFSDC